MIALNQLDLDLKSLFYLKNKQIAVVVFGQHLEESDVSGSFLISKKVKEVAYVHVIFYYEKFKIF